MHLECACVQFKSVRSRLKEVRCTGDSTSSMFLGTMVNSVTIWIIIIFDLFASGTPKNT